ASGGELLGRLRRAYKIAWICASRSRGAKPDHECPIRNRLRRFPSGWPPEQKPPSNTKIEKRPFSMLTLRFLRRNRKHSSITATMECPCRYNYRVTVAEVASPGSAASGPRPNHHEHTREVWLEVHSSGTRQTIHEQSSLTKFNTTHHLVLNGFSPQYLLTFVANVIDSAGRHLNQCFEIETFAVLRGDNDHSSRICPSHLRYYAAYRITQQLPTYCSHSVFARTLERINEPAFVICVTNKLISEQQMDSWRENHQRTIINTSTNHWMNHANKQTRLLNSL
ncbi:hypothetical protein DERF_014022, partial [Dermatophagoides farinae]